MQLFPPCCSSFHFPHGRSSQTRRLRAQPPATTISASRRSSDTASPAKAAIAASSTASWMSTPDCACSTSRWMYTRSIMRDCSSTHFHFPASDWAASPRVLSACAHQKTNSITSMPASAATIIIGITTSWPILSTLQPRCPLFPF